MGFFRLLIFHLGTKFGAKMLINAEIMAKIWQNSKLKMAAVLRFGFFENVISDK